ncbi:MAG: hypothetical protein IKK40_09360 [Bacteroidales bacterium]|nr:hypothetical protein [Bacteroidales bacterium]
MKFKSILAAIAILACGTVSAQNATKADLSKLESQLNALTQKVSQLETNLERVITENVNLVEQLNIKTVTSVTDANGIQWDIVKVEPNADTNDVLISLRITNNSGVKKSVFLLGGDSYAIDSDSNQANNIYKIYNHTVNSIELENGVPVNAIVTIPGVPLTSSYLSMIQLKIQPSAFDSRNKTLVKFTGVHIPW